MPTDRILEFDEGGIIKSRTSGSRVFFFVNE